MDFSRLENPQEAQRILTEILGYINHEIVPAIEQFALQMPAKNDLANRGMRTTEDGRDISLMREQAKRFRMRILHAATAFAETAAANLETEDDEKITNFFERYMKKIIKPVLAVERLLEERELVVTDDPFVEEVGSVEAAVEEARQNSHVALDEIFKS